MKRVLFVCTGNICRSPTAEGVARARLTAAGLAHRVTVDSAGTHGYHAGEAPDPRAQKAARQRGFDLSRQRARALEPDDFERFDLVLAMDRGHLEILLARCPPVHQHKVRLFMAYARQHAVDEVPDPYYGGPQGFERVLDLCEDAVGGLLEELGLGV
ncbi:MAG: low molecular weight protein-tyrosine-phosphatase [Rhodocyclaceae bacterium]|nr:low molecular weight protein-tyrosine-phosphatase [Rhodocyclaceae bacterium]